MIRRATEDDLPRLLAIASYAYPDFDVHASILWGEQALLNPDVGIWVGERTLGVSAVSAPFFAPSQKRGTMLFLAAEPRSGYEPVKMLRVMVDWSLNERGAVSFHFGESTGANLEPLARRIGGVPDSQSWTVTGGSHRKAHP
jgi:hypothetical protein